MDKSMGDEMENPYITRSPVRNPDEFYGRNEIKNRIFSDIARKQMQSHCIVGERRIGKTSLLNQILHREIQENHIKDIESFIFARTDITLFPDAPFTTFFEEWAKNISGVSGQAPSSDLGYLNFRKFIQNVTEDEYKIIIFLDEFEATRTNSNLDRGFFEFLRALTQNYNISFVLFSRIPLQYLMREEKFSSRFSSPFFNTINISYLRFLEESEARQLVIEPAENAGIDITDFEDFIIEQAYYHPFLLQQLCSIVFDHKKSSDMSHEKILMEFRIQTEEFFAYLWQHSDPDEQEALRKLSSNDQDISRITLDKLDRRSLLTDNRERIFCPAFEEFAKRQI